MDFHSGYELIQSPRIPGHNKDLSWMLSEAIRPVMSVQPKHVAGALLTTPIYTGEFGGHAMTCRPTLPTMQTSQPAKHMEAFVCRSDEGMLMDRSNTPPGTVTMVPQQTLRTPPLLPHPAMADACTSAADCNTVPSLSCPAKASRLSAPSRMTCSNEWPRCSSDEKNHTPTTCPVPLMSPWNSEQRGFRGLRLQKATYTDGTRDSHATSSSSDDDDETESSALDSHDKKSDVFKNDDAEENDDQKDNESCPPPSFSTRSHSSPYQACIVLGLAHDGNGANDKLLKQIAADVLRPGDPALTNEDNVMSHQLLLSRNGSSNGPVQQLLLPQQQQEQQQQLSSPLGIPIDTGVASTYTRRLLTAFNQWKYDVGSTLCAYVHNVMSWTGLDGDEFTVDGFLPEEGRVSLLGQDFSLVSDDERGHYEKVSHLERCREQGCQQCPAVVMPSASSMHDDSVPRHTWERLVRSNLEQAIESLTFMSYRRDFPPMYRLEDRGISTSGRRKEELLKITSDAGWGCVLRCSQMLLFEALKRHFIPTTSHCYASMQTMYEDHCGRTFKHVSSQQQVPHVIGTSANSNQGSSCQNVVQPLGNFVGPFYSFRPSWFHVAAERYLLNLFLDIPAPPTRCPFSVYAFVRSAGGGLGWALSLYGSMPVESNILSGLDYKRREAEYMAALESQENLEREKNEDVLRKAMSLSQLHDLDSYANRGSRKRSLSVPRSQQAQTRTDAAVCAPHPCAAGEEQTIFLGKRPGDCFLRNQIPGGDMRRNKNGVLNIHEVQVLAGSSPFFSEATFEKSCDHHRCHCRRLMTPSNSFPRHASSQAQQESRDAADNSSSISEASDWHYVQDVDGIRRWSSSSFLGPRRRRPLRRRMVSPWSSQCDRNRRGDIRASPEGTLPPNNHTNDKQEHLNNGAGECRCSKGVLVCFALTLGSGRHVTLEQQEALADYFGMPWFAGAIGSKAGKKQAFYFVGKHETYRTGGTGQQQPQQQPTNSCYSMSLQKSGQRKTCGNSDRVQSFGSLPNLDAYKVVSPPWQQIASPRSCHARPNECFVQEYYPDGRRQSRQRQCHLQSEASENWVSSFAGESCSDGAKHTDLGEQKKVELLYLDPHLVQTCATDLETSWDSFHRPKVFRTPISSLDPGLLLAFYCRDLTEVQRFADAIQQVANQHKNAPLYVSCNTRIDKHSTFRETRSKIHEKALFQPSSPSLSLGAEQSDLAPFCSPDCTRIQTVIDGFKPVADVVEPPPLTLSERFPSDVSDASSTLPCPPPLYPSSSARLKGAVSLQQSQLSPIPIVCPPFSSVQHVEPSSSSSSSSSSCYFSRRSASMERFVDDSLDMTTMMKRYPDGRRSSTVDDITCKWMSSRRGGARYTRTASSEHFSRLSTRGAGTTTTAMMLSRYGTAHAKFVPSFESTCPVKKGSFLTSSTYVRERHNSDGFVELSTLDSPRSEFLFVTARAPPPSPNEDCRETMMTATSLQYSNCTRLSEVSGAERDRSDTSPSKCSSSSSRQTSPSTTPSVQNRRCRRRFARVSSHCSPLDPTTTTTTTAGSKSCFSPLSTRRGWVEEEEEKDDEQQQQRRGREVPSSLGSMKLHLRGATDPPPPSPPRSSSSLSSEFKAPRCVPSSSSSSHHSARRQAPPPPPPPHPPLVSSYHHLCSRIKLPSKSFHRSWVFLRGRRDPRIMRHGLMMYHKQIERKTKRTDSA